MKAWIASLAILFVSHPALAHPLDDLAPGEWFEVPNTKLRAVAATTFERRDVSAVMSAWSGAAFDTERDRLIVWGGGDGDYDGNELYAFDIEQLKWSRLTDPNMIVGNGDPNPDGSPASRHTYSGLAYVPAPVDALFASGGSPWHTGCGAKAWLFRFQENRWTAIAQPAGSSCGDVAVYDEAAHRVWYQGPGSFQEYDVANNLWRTRVSESPNALYTNAAIDPVRHRFLRIGGDSYGQTGKTLAYALDGTGAMEGQTLATTGAKEIEKADGPGVEYDRAMGRVVAWSGQPTRNLRPEDVYSLDLVTGEWTRHVPAASNRVIPSVVTASGGTFGRFRYLPKRNAYMLVNSTDQNVFLYRLSTATAPPMDAGTSDGSGPPASSDAGAVTNDGGVPDSASPSGSRGGDHVQFGDAAIKGGAPSESGCSVTSGSSASTRARLPAACAVGVFGFGLLWRRRRGRARGRRQRGSLVGLLAGVLVGTTSTSAWAMDVPIVYVRTKRATTPVQLTAPVTIGGTTTTKSRPMKYTDLYMGLPEVGRFFSEFSAPSDIVYRAPDGTERVLFDCSKDATVEHACAAMDPAVSFDGKTIAFAVFRGSLENFRDSYTPKIVDPAATNEETLHTKMPGTFLNATEAQIYLVDVASGVVTPFPHSSGVFDSGPTWLSNGRLAFTSSRGAHRATLVWTNVSGALVSQIFTADIDGRNVELASYHALAGEQGPLQLLDGRVAYSSWQIFGRLPFRTTNGSPGGFGTLGNFFHLYTQAPDGAHNFALYGQHTASEGPPTHDAAHFIGQTTDGRVWTADYYARNNNGLGHIFGFPIPADGQEGVGPDEHPKLEDLYRPRNFVTFAPWAGQFDDLPGKLPTPFASAGYSQIVRAGKLGHPAGLPNNALMVTYGVGGCFNYADQMTTARALEADNADQPGCDVGIYRSTKIPSVHPSDLELVVNNPEYHEYMARAVVPYRAIYNVDAPNVVPRADLAAGGNKDLYPGTPYGIVGAASMLLRETKPLGGLRFESEASWGLQGTDTSDYSDDEICGVRFLAVMPNEPNEYLRLHAPTGERVAILGEVPVRQFDGNGAAIHDYTGAADTSFRVKIPANTPYLMQAVDCEGRTLNSDQTWQHVRPGEQKTCGGCHVHGKPGLDFSRTRAAADDYKVRTLGGGDVPLLTGGSGANVTTENVKTQSVTYEFERDVLPILKARCANCHSGSGASAGLVLDKPGTEEGSTWHRLVADQGQVFVPAGLRFQGKTSTVLSSPNLTKYVRFMNARGSLLYWKAANKRTDGRTDATQPNSAVGGWKDVDFGPNHPTAITRQELAVLARWIDLGAPGGDGYLVDTLAPTLTLVGKMESELLQGIYVGTTDTASGIRPDSFELCIVDSAGACATKLEKAIVENGIIDVPLPTGLADNQEIRARIADGAGNATEIQRTIGWLKGLAPPKPLSVDLDGGASDGSAGDGSSTSNNGLNPANPSESFAGCDCAIGLRPERGNSFGRIAVVLLGALFGIMRVTRSRAKKASRKTVSVAAPSSPSSRE